MLVLLLLVLCVCFHVACVMYLHLTSVQVGLTDLLLQHSAQRLDSSVHRVCTDATFSLDTTVYKTNEWQNWSSDTGKKTNEYTDNKDAMGINNNLCISSGY